MHNISFYKFPIERLTISENTLVSVMTQLDQEDYHLFHYSLVYAKDLHVSSIAYEGIGGVSILFFLWKVFTHTKKHKKQTNNFYSDILCAKKHKKHRKHKKWVLVTYFTHLKNIKSTKCNMFCRFKKIFAQLFYATKKAKTTCFVTFLSGDKKNKQPFLDSFKMPKKKALYFTCLLFMLFLCVKTFHKKIIIKYGNSPDTLIYDTTKFILLLVWFF